MEKTRSTQNFFTTYKFSPLVPNEGKTWLKPHNLLKERHKKRKKRFLNRITNNSIDDIKDDFGTDTSDTVTDENENESNDEENDHIDQDTGITCESADKDIQEDRYAEEYANHEGRQGSEVKCVEQTVTQRSDKKKAASLLELWGSKQKNKRWNSSWYKRSDAFC